MHDYDHQTWFPCVVKVCKTCNKECETIDVEIDDFFDKRRKVVQELTLCCQDDFYIEHEEYNEYASNL
jgi:hypothetical protein